MIVAMTVTTIPATEPPAMLATLATELAATWGTAETMLATTWLDCKMQIRCRSAQLEAETAPDLLSCDRAAWISEAAAAGARMSHGSMDRDISGNHETSQVRTDEEMLSHWLAARRA